MRLTFKVSVAVVALLLSSQVVQAGDNELTREEKAEGWQLLFNGRDHTGWKCSNGKEIATPVEQESLVPYESGGYLIIHEKEFGDFIFKCDVLMGEKCNSGVFFRVGDLSNPVQSGFEGQVMVGPTEGYHAFGAIYDLGPVTNLKLNDPGEWNSMTITAKGPHISISVNGTEVSRINCEEFTEPSTRPDGTKHKFKKAVKDFPRKGYIGLQDHGHKVWFKNIKILELDE